MLAQVKEKKNVAVPSRRSCFQDVC
uniref:Uncharacterized protein n=1 Tax=Arundo donax TaxID=35708 RepID=A0A0A8ZEU2_ARUDO